MTPILFASALGTLFGVLMCVTAIFLMLIVLVQRGRGGGLAGAFGGAGGQSAFGTKAGDLFTRITIGVATFWILLCIAALGLMGKERSRFGEDDEEAKDGTSVSAPAETGAEEGAGAGAAGGDGAPSSSGGSSGAGDSSGGADATGDAAGDASAGATPPKDGD